MLCRKWESAVGSEISWQVILPTKVRKDFVKKVHEGMTGGHLGSAKTEAQVSRRAYWPGWKTDVAAVLKARAPCAQYQRGNPPKRTPLKPLITGDPWERVSIDITGPHPKWSRGHEYILTLIDHFTKWGEAFPIRNHTAPTVVKQLVSQVFTRFGCPKQLLSDQGPEFDSVLMTELCKSLHIDKVRTSPYKASTNGAVERFHRTLNSMLGKVVAENQRDWDEWLPLVMAAYRASPHSATKLTPNMLMLGREVMMPVDIVLGRPEADREEDESYDSFVGNMAARLEEAFKIARSELQCAAERRKRNYDLRVREQTYNLGDWVWYYCPRRYQRKSPKWQRMFSGPFLIVKCIRPANYVIQRTKGSQPKVVHADKLKLWNGDPPPSWLTEAVSEDPAPAAVVEPDVAPENPRHRKLFRRTQCQIGSLK